MLQNRALNDLQFLSHILFPSRGSAAPGTQSLFGWTNTSQGISLGKLSTALKYHYLYDTEQAAEESHLRLENEVDLKEYH